MIDIDKTIKSEDLAREISNALKQYVDDVKVASQEVAEKVAKSTAEELKQNSPKRARAKGGKYAKNWTYEIGDAGATVYNKAPTYRLTHLLEKGHAKRGGGRVSGIPHIAPAEERAIQQYEQELIKGVEK